MTQQEANEILKRNRFDLDDLPPELRGQAKMLFNVAEYFINDRDENFNGDDEC